MVKNNYPRVLIFGPPFNNFTGGGITLSNLFKGWPKDRVAVASTGHVLFKITSDICDTYYLLGNEEHRYLFPFNLLQKPFPSGLMSVNNDQEEKYVPRKKGIRGVLVDGIFRPAIYWLGIVHFLSKLDLSSNFKEWLSVYQPEILYFQISSREDILFSIKLCDYLKIPSVIHMMDDWPSTISNKGLFKKFWKTKIDKELKMQLDRMDLYLSISHAMTSEYKSRYKKEFKAFHNPVELEAWHPFRKTEFKLSSDHVNILYSGRIGKGITESLVEVANEIDAINLAGGKIKFYIQSYSSDFKVRNTLQKNDCIVINPTAAYTDLPRIFSQADILIIANDFDEQGINFLKYSMPTKVTEYMISGTPILVYAPYETAVSRFLDVNECACCVSEHSGEKLQTAIKYMIDDEEYRKKLSKNAVSLAIELFDANKVKQEFQELLINIAQ